MKAKEQAVPHGPTGVKARNHLVCLLLEKNPLFTRHDALRKANKIMAARRLKHAKKNNRTIPQVNLNTTLWFGKFQGSKVKNVPIEYWTWFLEHTINHNLDRKLDKLRDFLTDTLYLLRGHTPQLRQPANLPPLVRKPPKRPSDLQGRVSDVPGMVTRPNADTP
jgi:uncharacterized protein (DUF3820 family)